MASLSSTHMFPRGTKSAPIGTCSSWSGFTACDGISASAPFLARLIDVESKPGARGAQIRSFGYFEDDAIVQYDPPATASFYVSQENPVLGRGVIMQWVTLPERGSL